MAAASWEERPPRGLWEFLAGSLLEPYIEINALAKVSVPKLHESVKILM